ncbi:MAG TPA: permease-like cell division protein FtsX [Steroidobacteraceae bacterium]|nr:permease-like cell division protein FtsX [Steroidobacteraceae bacterium]
MSGANWWGVYYRLREAREGIARNTLASLATVVLLTLTLLMFGAFLWLNSNLGQLAGLLERQVQVRVFAAEGTPARDLIAGIKAIPGVGAVELLDGEAVYQQLAGVFGQETLMRALPADAFSDSLSVELQDPSQGSAVVSRMRTVAGVGDVIWGQGFADVLYRVSEGLQKGGIVLLVGFFVAAVLMSVTSMHLAVLNREVEIKIQRWVGVSPWGVRVQFLVEAFLLGLLSSILAAAAFLYLGDVLQRTIARLVPFMAEQLTSPTMAIGVVLLTGPVLALIGGGLASQRAIGIRDQ